MNLLNTLKSAGQWVWNKLSGGNQEPVVSPIPSSGTQANPGIRTMMTDYQNQMTGTPRQTLPPPSGGGGQSFSQDDNYQTQSFNMDEWISSFLNSLKDPMEAEIDSWWKRLDEYDKNNPFAFDEALAKASSQERLNPYYDATMNEFMTGVRRSSARSVEDMTRTIGELNVDASKLSEKERLSTQEAIRSSEEGFAGAGLFFSGKNQRATGLQEVQGAQTQEGIQTNLQRGLDTSTRSNTRLQEDLALQTARQNRLTTAERTTALETDLAKQRKESEMQRALEQVQFAGRGTNLSTAQRMQLENQFLPGLT